MAGVMNNGLRGKLVFQRQVLVQGSQDGKPCIATEKSTHKVGAKWRCVQPLDDSHVLEVFVPGFVPRNPQEIPDWRPIAHVWRHPEESDKPWRGSLDSDLDNDVPAREYVQLWAAQVASKDRVRGFLGRDTNWMRP